MERLIDGYRRFRSEQWPRERDRFERLAQGQEPQALVIACSDSRVDPSMVFDAAPGELFVVRNVANLVPPFAPDAAYHGTSAAIEFAVRALHVPNVIVLGHGSCGGVQALLEGAPPSVSDFVGQWMKIGEPARQRALAGPHAHDRQQTCEQEIVRLSLDNLLSFRWVREAVEARRLRLWGCHFDIRTGLLQMIGPDNRFTPISETLGSSQNERG
ncbi:MAG: carbonic anhydrase [Rhodoplanes sp.]